MFAVHRREPHTPMPKLRPRAVVFGLLLLLFAAGTLLAGLGIGITKGGLPAEYHPSMLLGKDDLPTLRGRLGREPYRQWSRRLVALAETKGPPPTTEPQRALQAKALAFAFVLQGDRRYADQAAELLRHARPPSRGADWRNLDDLVEGAAAYAVTYDLLGGYLHSQADLDRRTRTLVAELAHELYRSTYFLPAEGRETRRLRQFSALGLCALAIRGMQPSSALGSPQKWYRRAKLQALDVLRRLTTRDGAYGEGPARQFAAVKLYLPFLLANAELTGENVLPEEAVRTCQWSVRIRMPSGLRPDLGASELAPPCAYLLTGLSDDGGLFRWDAAGSDLGALVPDDQLPEALCFYDDRVKPTAPPWAASEALRDSGDLLFRSGWGQDAGYLLLRAPRPRGGRAVGRGTAEETSITLARGNEVLVMTPGATGELARDPRAAAAAGNALLVDGLGPSPAGLGGLLPQAPQDYPTEWVSQGEVTAARVRRTFGGATVDRVVMLLQKRTFVVFDHARARSGSHDFTWLLHVNAAGSTGGCLAVTGNQARVHRDGADLCLSLHSPWPGGEDLEQRVDLDRLHGGRDGTHGVVQAQVRGQWGADFLAVLSPLSAGEPAPEVSDTHGLGWIGVTVDRTCHVAFRLAEGEPIGDERVSTDGYALYWTGAAAQRLALVLVLGATRVWTSGKLSWSSARPRDVVLRPRAAAAAQRTPAQRTPAQQAPARALVP